MPYLAALIFAPLAWGTVETWSLAVMEALVFLSFLLCWRRIARQEEQPFYRVPGELPLLLLLGWMLVQIVPLPFFLVKLLSPGAAAVYSGTLGIEGPVRWASLSLNGKATAAEFFRIAAYAAMYVVTVQILASKLRLRQAAAFVALFASSMALLAVTQYLLPGHYLFSFRDLPEYLRPFGPYVNRNHYAGLMGMLFPVLYALFLHSRPSVRDETFWERLKGLFNVLSQSNHLSLAFSVILVAASVVICLSRTGIVSLALSIIVFGILLTWRGVGRRRGVAALMVVALVVVYVGWYGWGPVMERFAKLFGPEAELASMRPEIWKDTRAMIGDFPLTGSGFGTFVDLYPRYRSIPGTEVLYHAHNDYLQLLAEGGLVAAGLVLWFLAAVGRAFVRLYRRRRETYSIVLSAGCASGVVYLLLHSFTDFNLQIGANGLYFFFLLGLTVSAAATRLHERKGNTLLEPLEGKGQAGRMTAAAALLLALSLLFNGGSLAAGLLSGETGIAALRRDRNGEERKLAVERAAAAVRFDPFEARRRYDLANARRAAGDADGALESLRRAVSLAPSRAEYLQRLALVHSEKGDFEQADRLFRAGVEYDRHNPVRHRIYGSWLMSRGESGRGRTYLRSASAMEPAETESYITLMVLYGMSDEEILESLPRQAAPLFRFAEYLVRTERRPFAEEVYAAGIDSLVESGEKKASYFATLARYYSRQGRDEDALAVMRKAIAFIPEDAGLHLRAGELYERVSNTYRAAEEYQAALLLDPLNSRARKALNLLREKNGAPGGAGLPRR